VKEKDMAKPHRSLGARAALLALTAMIGACSSSDDRDRGMYGDEGKHGRTVEMTSSHQFSPREVTIKVGESVTWKNSANDVHTVTADPSRAKMKENVSMPANAKPFHSGDILPGKTWKQTFSTPGTYKYVCVYHEDKGMMGTVIVKPTGANPY
jgi:plastocyanin